MTAPDHPARTTPLRGGPFRLLWGSQTASVFGDGLTVLSIPLLVLALTHNPVAAALAAASRTVGYLISGLVAGAIVDRAASRRVMVVADSARALIFLLLLFLVVTGNPGVTVVLLLAFTAAAAGVFYETASAVVLQDLLAAEDLVKGNARLELTNQLGLLIGSATVGAIVVAVGIDATTGVIAAFYTVSVLTALLIQVPSGTERGRAVLSDIAGVVRDLLAGFGYLLRDTLVRAVVSLQAMINFLIAAETLLIFFAHQTLGLSPIAISLIVAASGLGGLLATSVAEPLFQRFGGPPMVGYSITTLSLAICGLGLASDGVVLFALNLLIGGSSITASINIRAIRQRIVPRDLLGRVTGTARTLGYLTTPIGAVLAGTLTSTNGNDPRPVFLGAGALGVAVALISYFLVLRHHRHR